MMSVRLSKARRPTARAPHRPSRRRRQRRECASRRARQRPGRQTPWRRRLRARALSGVRFHTATSSPRASAARTKPAPINPVPKCAIISLLRFPSARMLPPHRTGKLRDRFSLRLRRATRAGNLRAANSACRFAIVARGRRGDAENHAPCVPGVPREAGEGSAGEPSAGTQATARRAGLDIAIVFHPVGAAAEPQRASVR